MFLALYQPEIPQNTGTLIRTCACFGVPIDLIHPLGFVFSSKRLQRSAMDYADHIQLQEHMNWEAFYHHKKEQKSRLILLTPRGQQSHWDFQFLPTDTLLLGQESCGVPEVVEKACDETVFIPMINGVRSLNVAIAGAIVLTESLRQTK